jgi:hypothetical protein
VEVEFAPSPASDLALLGVDTTEAAPGDATPDDADLDRDLDDDLDDDAHDAHDDDAHDAHDDAAEDPR